MTYPCPPCLMKRQNNLQVLVPLQRLRNGLSLSGWLECQVQNKNPLSNLLVTGHCAWWGIWAIQNFWKGRKWAQWPVPSKLQKYVHIWFSWFAQMGTNKRMKRPCESHPPCMSSICQQWMAQKWKWVKGWWLDPHFWQQFNGISKAATHIMPTQHHITPTS
jgi:hypothetical protein